MNRSLTIFRVIINFIIVITNILQLYITYVWTSHSPDKKKEKKNFMYVSMWIQIFIWSKKRKKKQHTYSLQTTHESQSCEIKKKSLFSFLMMLNKHIPLAILCFNSVSMHTTLLVYFRLLAWHTWEVFMGI